MYNSEFFEYIADHINDNVSQLMLNCGNKGLSFPIRDAIIQIEARQKTSRKLARFINNPRFIFPTTLSAEQATHQCVASYHAELIGSDNSILDMTAGLGIDVFSLCFAGNRLTAIELERDRFDALVHNKDILKLPDIEIIEGDSVKWISDHVNTHHFDMIFIDPARRDSNNRKTYFFKDCLPDITQCFDDMQRIADKIIIKASPIVDIKAAINELKYVSDLHIVCVKGECKEVLLICDTTFECKNPSISVIDLKDNTDASVEPISKFEITFDLLDNRDILIANQEDVKIGAFIYDPNAGLHKLHCSGEICNQFVGLKKLSRNTELYISDIYYPTFPGRIFMIDSLPSKSDLKNFKGKEYEVISRNYPIAASVLKQKYNVKSSKENFLIACKIGHKEATSILATHRKDVE